MVAIRIDHRQTRAREQKGVLELAFFRVTVIGALRVADRHARAAREAAAAIAVETAQRAGAEHAVERGTERVIKEAHPGVDVRLLRRATEVFAEVHRVVAREFGVEGGVAVVRVAEAARQLELLRHLPQIAVRRRVLVAAVLRAEEIIADVLHRVEPQAVSVGAVDFPTGGAGKIVLHVLAVEVRVRGEDRRREAVVRPEADVGAVGFVTIVFGVIRVADELDLRMRAALGGAEVQVRGARFLGDVHEARRAQVPHLELIAVIADARPVAVETVGGDLEMKILRQHAGIEVDGRRGAVTRHVEPAVVHDVIQVDADAEAVRRFHESQEVGLRAVVGGDGAFLILAAEVEGIKQVVAYRQCTAALGRRRKPDRIVPRFGQLGHLGGDLVPTRVEVLQHRLRTQGSGAAENLQSQHENDDPGPETTARLHEKREGAEQGGRAGRGVARSYTIVSPLPKGENSTLTVDC